MKLKRTLYLFVLIVVAVILFSGCDFLFQNSAEITVKNQSGETIEVTVDGIKKELVSGGNDIWIIKWDGLSEYTVFMKATNISSDDPATSSENVTLGNNDSYTWYLQ